MNNTKVIFLTVVSSSDITEMKLLKFKNVIGYIHKPFDVKEIDCWATGDRTCRFKITPQ